MTPIPSGKIFSGGSVDISDWVLIATTIHLPATKDDVKNVEHHTG